MKYLEFIFRTQPPTEAVRDVLCATLADIGFEAFVHREDGLEAYVAAAMFSHEALDEALAALPLPGMTATYTCREADDRDWNAEWERNFFQPLVIGDQVVVHSTFHRDVPTAAFDIVINPQMAFGTGHHETTGLIMAELLEADLEGKRVLDMGCGTAILAILARMKGAAGCVGIDIDDWCVRNARENIALNRLEGIDIFEGDAALLPAAGSFDFIVANINRNILLADMPAYAAAMRRGAHLLLSGFYADDVPMLTAKAGEPGLQLLHTRERNRWAMMHLILPR